MPYAGVAHQGFAAQLEQDAPVAQVAGRRAAAPGPISSRALHRAPQLALDCSPSWKRAKRRTTMFSPSFATAP